ncbi:MAG TPA: bifunctional acetate--CoA ligase family protein/GNAT family N-acetyltransferase [Xanthobacteraceae bacterium]|nr:bifunctional acetate--CoA ligase family protein/GNAT family N-acetyltransferase [Xanthobacteraceae bacterium]
MSTYRLDRLFAPRSVAIVGASPREHSLGRTILRNMFGAGFPGHIHVVNPDHPQIDGVATVASIAALSEAPDLAVIAVPPAAVPESVAAAAAKGVAAAVIITAGLGHGPGSFAEAAIAAARPRGLRLVGPNCLGVIVPAAKLNASFASRMAASGDLALISQSGAIVAGMVEWAAQRAIGFSAVVSIGDQADVDFGDLLDYFANDRATRAILLYVESIKDARKFMSAARAAARAKPVIGIKAGRHAEAARAAATHTGALAGSDAVYDAVFRRAGLLRVRDLDELFDAAETLARLRPFPGKRLTILTNGGGIGVLALDRLADFGGTAAELSAETLAKLDAVLPPTWSRSNPVDIIGDADADRYAAALDVLLNSPDSDALLVLNVPTALASPQATAARVAETTAAYRARVYGARPVFAVWVGEDSATAEVFDAARIPHFHTETEAVRGFMHLVRYREAQDALMETPPSLPEHFTRAEAAARDVVERALADKRVWLDPLEVAKVFAAYAIPIAPVALARDADEAATAAIPLLASGAVAVKIFSRDIVHKSDVGGVRLNLASEKAVRRAAAEVIARARAARPDARIEGVVVQSMIARPKARELLVGLADDPTFGPVVAFGWGGTAVATIDDKALALPPLDLNLAHDLIARTRVARLLQAYRNVPAAREDEIALVLVKIAQLAADIPEIRELDINPLLADESGVIAVDARVAIAPLTGERRGRGHPRFAVRPYPTEWERTLRLGDGREIFVRPIRPDDEAMVRAFFTKVTMEDVRLRFFAPMREFSHEFIARLTQLDYARAIALVAIDPGSGGMLGAVRLHADANFDRGEYAILVRSDLKGHGLGWTLMQIIIEYARWLGLKSIEGQVLRENTTMLQMCRELGFSVTSDPDDRDLCIVTLPIAPGSAGEPSR